jgi:4-hydroxybenzoate polyprenyltransferase
MGSMSVKALIQVARPIQWSKNLLVFAALLFTASFRDPHLALLAVEAFFAMSLVSSSVYIANDILDIERDRVHPKKRNRPIASGLIPIGLAWSYAIVLAIISLGLAFTITHTTAALLVVYLALQVAYNLGLKAKPVTDVFVIATGFILRAVVGAAAISVPISSWLLFCTGALALMLGFSKRRAEFIQQGEDRSKSRESLEAYSLAALDALVIMTSVSAGLSYAIYVIESMTGKRYPGLVLTAPFVYYGVSRYLYLVFKTGEGDQPERMLFKDKHILVTIIGFVVVAALAVRGILHLSIVN